MPQFELANALPQIVWLALVFAALFLLSRAMLPKVEQVQAERARVIGADLASAEAAKQAAHASVGSFETALGTARAEANRVTGDAKSAAATATAAQLKTVDGELTAKTTDAMARIETARSEALAKLDDVAATAAADIVERLTGRRPSADQANSAVAGARA